ncbi:hypothetical protein KR054_006992 [Drosophila jambulina]|nr:hypothetical protein KR054_006992 [Drosophila jambulina]
MNAAVCVVVTVPTEAEEQRLNPRACSLCGGSLLEGKGSAELCKRCWQLSHISGNGLDTPTPAATPRGRSLPLNKLKEDASLEQLLHAIAEELCLEYDVFWSQDLSGRQLQARFDLQQDERLERLLCTLQAWGVGERPGTHVSAINCLETRDKPPDKQHLQQHQQQQLLQQQQQPHLSAGNLRDPQQQQEQQQQQQILQQDRLSQKHVQTLNQGWQTFMDSVRCRLNVNQVVRQVRRDATLTFDFVVLLISAALLSCVGLVENSFLFLSSSMLISPLMGPIIAAIFGSVIGDRDLCWLGLKNELLGIAVSVAIGFVFGGIVCGFGYFFAISTGLTEEIVSRCDTHSLAINVCTALASGAAGAIAVLGGNTGSLVGVAISASLLPPAVNAGLLSALAIGTRFLAPDHELLQSLQKHRTYSDHLPIELMVCAGVSMALTLLNIVCVWLMGVVVLRIKEVAPAVQRNQHFWHHDLRTAREVALLDPALQNAIDQLDESQAGGQSSVQDSGQVGGMGGINNYHTVHGFKEFCLTVHRLNNGNNAKEAPMPPMPLSLPNVMELFAPLQAEPEEEIPTEEQSRNHSASASATSRSALSGQPQSTDNVSGNLQCGTCHSLPNLRPLGSELSLPSMGSLAGKDQRQRKPGEVLIPLPTLEPKESVSPVQDRPLNLLAFGQARAGEPEEAHDDECQA